MTTSGIPEHFSSVTPSLTVTPCSEAIDFYKEAFGAEEVLPRMTGPDGLVGHAEIKIGESVIMLGDEWPDAPTRSPTTLGGSTSALHIYTDDVDTLWQQAIDAGCRVVSPSKTSSTVIGRAGSSTPTVIVGVWPSTSRTSPTRR